MTNEGKQFQDFDETNFKPISEDNWGEEDPSFGANTFNAEKPSVTMKTAPTSIPQSRAPVQIEVQNFVFPHAGTVLGILLPRTLGLSMDHVSYFETKEGGDGITLHITEQQQAILTPITRRLMYVDGNLKNARDQYVHFDKSVFSFLIFPL
jgi:hypothetical protein